MYTIKRHNAEDSLGFGTDITLACVPLLIDHLSRKSTFLWQDGGLRMTGFTANENVFLLSNIQH